MFLLNSCHGCLSLLLLHLLFFFALLFFLDPRLLLLGHHLALLRQLLLLLLTQALLLLLSNELAAAWRFRSGRLREWLQALLPELLGFSARVNVEASVDDFAKLLDLFKGLLIFLFHLPDDLQRSVLLAEDAVVAFAIDALHLEEVVGPPGALNVEGNHAAGVLALDASATMSFAADDALQVEPLHIYLAHAHWRFRRHGRARDPHSATQMHPLVEGLCGHSRGVLEALLISLQEKGVVFGDFCN